MTKDELKKVIGESIRRERVKRFMSIEQLAEKLDLSSGFVGLIEHGRRGATTYNLYRIAKIFDISVDKLYASAPPKILKFSEDSANSKHKQFTRMAQDLTEQEFDFLISIIKMLYGLRTPSAETIDSDVD